MNIYTTKMYRISDDVLLDTQVFRHFDSMMVYCDEHEIMSDHDTRGQGHEIYFEVEVTPEATS